MLVFAYRQLPSGPNPPPTAGTSPVKVRPLITVTLAAITGPLPPRTFGSALIDSGADDTVFPVDAADSLKVATVPSGQQIVWRGRPHPVRYGKVILSIDDGREYCRWEAMVAFSPAPIRYPLLGNRGFFDRLDVRFLLVRDRIEIEPNANFDGQTGPKG